MTTGWGAQSMVAPLRRVLLVRPVPPPNPDCWRNFGYVHPIDQERAAAEHAALVTLLEREGIETIVVEPEDPALQDAIFPFDPVLVTSAGAILLRMGKELRQPEVAALERVLRDLGIPIVGRIQPPGTVEGGDCLWLDEHTLIVGRSYRTNDTGIAQLADLLRPKAVQVIAVDLAHWHGPSECLHLLSLLSPVDTDLVVAYLPLLPVRLAEMLVDRRIEIITVPEDEFATQAPNVLALAPRRCVILKENQRTIAALERAGCTVFVYEGREISHNRSGGPTCLTRPLLRAW
ncbi:dimethylarginine dimethylaminohydrolase family protein [Thermomicrobium roseum]|uniref:arginine deiminase n=1 Tax=Thermomicrobium roseum (strain ATCC 27502 / DSM 5159 / P-2) TaxID=309801 RepID=B9L1M2_THERP|nr:arginine deiminase family protein [Thermomicrobium roseum]ACM04589.1 putative arginine deiminase [Thermomicrobium roseum DSM 5159]